MARQVLAQLLLLFKRIGALQKHQTIYYKKILNMKVGDKVKKIKGYQFAGMVVAVFQNSKGQVRVVVEHFGSQTEDSGGMLHIFNTKQLQVII